MKKDKWRRFRDAREVTIAIVRMLMKSPHKPVCAKCNKIVDAFDLDIENFNDLYLYFKCRCHGESQNFTVHKAHFMAANKITLGKAFETPDDVCIGWEGSLKDLAYDASASSKAVVPR